MTVRDKLRTSITSKSGASFLVSLIVTINLVYSKWKLDGCFMYEQTIVPTFNAIVVYVAKLRCTLYMAKILAIPN